MKRIATIVVFLLFLVFALTLNLKNPETVTLRYYFDFEQEFDLFLVLFIPFASGLLLGVLMMSFSLMRKKMDASKAKKDLERCQQEIQNLRAVPIKEPMKDEVQ